MNLIQFLVDNNEYIVVQGDKNLGPCILERVYYIYKAFEEHLGNERNYRQLSLTAAQGRQRGLQYMLRDWISKYKPRLPHEKPTKYVCISNAEYIFLSRALHHKTHSRDHVTTQALIIFGMQCAHGLYS